ncbi:MAG: hypothetical protein DWP95_00295 [Proteobacteria bacterium]|nr:MAG: hypothetical protein DWP95_00295 [Pseudomonadota bacterium]
MKNKDPNLHQLYQSGNKAQPPKNLDAAILAHAEQAFKPTRLGRMRPWLAAASVLLTVPILWLMLQQPELQLSRQESLPLDAMPSPAPATDNPKAMDEAQATESAELSDYLDPQDLESEQGPITVTGSRIKHQNSKPDEVGIATSSAAEKKQSLPREAKRETSKPIALKAEPEIFAEDSMSSTAASYAPDNTQIQQTSATIAELIKHLKPKQLSETEQALWQDLQQQIENQQWHQCHETLKQLKQNHPALDFTGIDKRIEQLSKH